MNLTWQHLERVHLVWIVLLYIAALVVLEVRARSMMSSFLSPIMQRRLTAQPSFVRAMVRIGLIGAALLLCVGALMRPQARGETETVTVSQASADVLFVVDVSRSMLADDAAPNRLERAKQQIKDTVDEMAGDRVGLLVFAGDVKQQIPLTTHYDDFKQSLDAVGPHNVRRGGSRLGDAIDAASHAFLTKSNAHKAMVVFTDGEDQESDPVAAARKAHKETGVRIFTVGLGDMDKGSRIPLESERQAGYLEHDGALVWSKLHGDTLRQIATETDGAYVPAGTKQVNMADVYHNYIAGVEQTEFETARISQYEARYQWVLVPALAFLLAEIVITTWPARGAAAESRIAAAAHQKAPAKRSHRTSSPQQSTAA